LSVSNFKKGVIFSNPDNHSTQVNIICKSVLFSDKFRKTP